MEAIMASGLAKRFGQVQAVNGVSFSVEQGEIFGLLGPNGAGKSTTQRLLTGLLAPDSGEVRLLGYHLQRQPLAAKQLIGVVPELANVYVDLSAWGNLMFIADLYGVGKKERTSRAGELLEMFGLYDKRYLKAKSFSKGMKQRLLLAMAMISDPRILFLDEPTSGLDVQSTKLLRELIREFNRRGKTVFLTTHNIEEANQLCDRVAIINHGRLAAVDRPENLKQTLQRLQGVEVAFHPQLPFPVLLENLPGVSEVKKAGDRFVLTTAHPGEVFLALSDLAREQNLDILSLNTLGPTLEDVFLHLTGQSREKEGEEYAS